VGSRTRADLETGVDEELVDDGSIVTTVEKAGDLLNQLSSA